MPTRTAHAAKHSQTIAKIRTLKANAQLIEIEEITSWPVLFQIPFLYTWKF